MFERNVCEQNPESFCGNWGSVKPARRISRVNCRPILLSSGSSAHHLQTSRHKAPRTTVYSHSIPVGVECRFVKSRSYDGGSGNYYQSRCMKALTQISSFVFRQNWYHAFAVSRDFSESCHWCLQRKAFLLVFSHVYRLVLQHLIW